jgi:heme exporter protein C
MKTNLLLARVAAVGAFASLALLPRLEWDVRWALPAGLLLYAVLCGACARLPRATHLAVGWLLVAYTLYQVCFRVPVEEIQLGTSYLIFFFHYPSAISCLALFIIAGGISVYQLRTGSTGADLWAASAVQVGVLACTITLATGMVWAEAAWGKPWVWTDRRLLTVAIMWFTYAAYLVFRLAVDNPVQRARYSSVLAIVFALNVPLVWYAIRWFGEVSHPMSLEMFGAQKQLMDYTKWWGLGAFFILYLGLWRMRRQVLAAEERLERLEEDFAVLKI